MKDKLKPCPFCGGEARLIKGGESRLIFRYFVDCDCMRSHINEISAVEAWNTRHEPELKEQLKNALKDVLKVVENSDHWWMDCPDKGGIGAEKIEKLLEQLK